jgi:signal transduction histidine kinase
MFARYLRPDVELPLPETAPAVTGPKLRDGTATLVRTITLKGQPIGKVYLRADTTEWNSTLLGFGGIIALLFVVVLMVGLLVSSWLQRIVTDPIIELAALMRRVGQERDVKLRAVKRGNDELGILVDGFNDMLDEIGKARAEIEHGRDELHKLNEGLEQRVVDRTLQLETANKELETFSYSVSHDLRAPLRAIDGFSSILLEEHGNSLTDDGRDCLKRIRQGAQRMGFLIDDLLKLARVTRAEPAREKVDLSTMAREVGEAIRIQNAGRDVQFVITPDLSTNADPRLLRIVLENLVGNAWKFTASRNGARIELGREFRDGIPVYIVRDNGAGFDMSYANKLFAPFQRLHSTEEFPGTGIGLATVQRIVRKHGGQIWADGVVGKGAAFYFTLGETA